MKHVIATALLVASMGAVAQESANDRWVDLGEYQGGRVSMDSRSVTSSRDTPNVKYWVRYERNDGIQRNAYEEVNCDTKERRKISEVIYKGGKVIGSQAAPSPWQPLIPETVGEHVGNVACAVREKRLNEDG